MRNIHVWKRVNEEGEKVEVREVWPYFESPSDDDLLELRDILWRKYQRKRLPHDDVASIERMLRERGVPLPPL